MKNGKKGKLDGIEIGFGDLKLSDIICVETKYIKTPYVEREAESFSAIRLQSKAVPGFATGDHIRVIRLDSESPSVHLIPIRFISKIDGKSIAPPKTSWGVTGSGGKTYTVKLKGGKYSCTCKGFQFRKKCKHTEQIKNDTQ